MGTKSGASGERGGTVARFTNLVAFAPQKKG